MSFLMEDDKLLKSGEKLEIELLQNFIANLWRVKNIKELKYGHIKVKRKLFFHNGKIPKQDCNCICFSSVLIDSVLK